VNKSKIFFHGPLLLTMCVVRVRARDGLFSCNTCLTSALLNLQWLSFPEYAAFQTHRLSDAMKRLYPNSDIPAPAALGRKWRIQARHADFDSLSPSQVSYHKALLTPYYWSRALAGVPNLSCSSGRTLRRTLRCRDCQTHPPIL